MRGGASYGQGVHGRVIDVSSSDASDRDTLQYFLSHAVSQEWVLYIALDNGYRVFRESALSPMCRRVMRVISGMTGGAGRGTRMVAKMFVNDTPSVSKHISPKDAFLAELVTNIRILSAFGTRKAQRLTTIQGVAVGSDALFGISVGEVYFTLQRLCESKLEDMSFFSSRDAVNAFIVDLLNGFAHVHAANIFHGDVKLDNIMFCGGSYKLIDWGYSASFAETRELCATTRTPRNCASPMAWFAWGVPSDSPDGDISHALHLVMNTKIVRRSVFLLPGFRRLVDGAYASYTAQLAALHTTHGLTSAVRVAVIRDLIPSFDLYNFGLVVASIALSSSIGVSDTPLREALLGLSTRLMYYSHPEYVGKDAITAVAWWQQHTAHITVAHHGAHHGAHHRRVTASISAHRRF